MCDKEIEKQRYNRRSEELINNADSLIWKNPILLLPEYLREPYKIWLSYIKSVSNQPISVLELGSGAGIFTGFLIRNKFKRVIATDLASASVEIMKSLFQGNSEFDARIADIEKLTFKSNSFDLVTSCGVLSYGDNEIVLKEIHRVLKPNGVFVCVDSFNTNPFYRLNRWLHYFRGDRSKSTLLRMPGTTLIDSYRQRFRSVEVQYFGSFVFLVPFLKLIFLSETIIARIINGLDRLKIFEKLAFKIVMVCQK